MPMPANSEQSELKATTGKESCGAEQRGIGKLETHRSVCPRSAIRFLPSRRLYGYGILAAAVERIDRRAGPLIDLFGGRGGVGLGVMCKSFLGARLTGFVSVSARWRSVGN